MEHSLYRKNAQRRETHRIKKAADIAVVQAINCYHACLSIPSLGLWSEANRLLLFRGGPKWPSRS